MATSLELDNFLKSYLDLNRNLAKTVVIKSSASNDILNDFLVLKYGSNIVDQNDPTSWKYYRNIAGEYHPLDSLMTITSLDTLEEITFSKENLALHVTTRNAYKYGSRYYYSLVNRYPEQEQLILGILYPVDINKAIEAKEGSILGYPSGLVEPQEITLISELESFIKRYLIRWNVQAFGLSDSLYNAAYHALLYMHILPKLLNLRLKRCKTYEAHSFHIRQYLASHGRLDRYLPYMTLKQSLFFYRNIEYLFNNAGKVEQFDLLIEKLLTDRHIPISEYSIRQLNTFDDQFYPDIIARMKPINVQYNVPEKNYIPVTDLFEKERPLVYGNETYYRADENKDIELFKTSASSVIQTKDLQSAMVDYNDAVPDPLERVLLRQWAYMAHHGLYDVVINFQDPVSGDLRALYAADVFIYMYYIQLKSLGFDTTTLPVFLNIKARRHPKPTIGNLLSVVDSKYKDLPDIAQVILDNQPEIAACYSTSMFFELSHKLYEQAKAHWILVSNTGDLYKRALIENMVLQLYHTEVMTLNTQGMTTEQWLSHLNIPTYNYSYNEAQALILEIFTKATGMTVDQTKLLKNIQSAMIALLSELSSYSIQCIQEINSSNIIPLNWPAVRPGNIGIASTGAEYLYRDVSVIQTFNDSIHNESLPINQAMTSVNNIILFKGNYQIDIANTVELGTDETREVEVPLPTLGVTVDYNGYAAYQDLSAEQKAVVSSLKPF